MSGLVSIRRFFFLLLSLQLSGAALHADDDRMESLRIAVSGGACLNSLGELMQLTAPDRLTPRKPKLQSFLEHLFRNFSTRMPATAVASVRSYDPQPPVGTKVHYVQSLPGKSKILRKYLTAEELNILFNQIRTFFLSAGIVDEEREVQLDFKSTRYNIDSEKEDAERILRSVQRAEEAFRNLQKPHFHTGLLGPNAEEFLQSRMLVVGSGNTEMQAILAGRFSNESFADYEDVKGQVRDGLYHVHSFSKHLRAEMQREPNWQSLLDENGAAFSYRFFKMLREAEDAQDIRMKLEDLNPQADPVQVAALAQKIFLFFRNLDKFVPGTQYSRDQLAIVDENRAPVDMSYPEGTTSLLVVDVKGAGARILRETLSSIEKSLAPYGEISEISVEEVIEQIRIDHSIHYLKTSLEAAIHLVQSTEGDNLISFWVTGDEVIFYLRRPSAIHQRTGDGDRSFRITEEALAGFENLNRLDQSWLRELSEKAMKILEEEFSRLKAQSLKLSSAEGAPRLTIFVSEPSQESVIRGVEERLRESLQRIYPNFSLIEELEVELAFGSTQTAP